MHRKDHCPRQFFERLRPFLQGRHQHPHALGTIWSKQHGALGKPCQDIAREQIIIGQAQILPVQMRELRVIHPRRRAPNILDVKQRHRPIAWDEFLIAMPPA